MKMLLFWSISALFLICFQDVESSCLTDGTPPGHNFEYADLSNATFDFALRKYKQMLSDPAYSDSNIFTSPYSLWSSLTLAYLGSRSQTHKDLAKLLGLSGFSTEQVENEYVKYLQRLKSPASGRKGDVFKSANLIAFSKRSPLRSCVTSNGYVEAQEFDFQHRADYTRRRINAWVADQTDKAINELLSEGSITSDTLMVILNAVFFKGSWKYNFNDADTKKDFFVVSPGEIREVNMMKIKTRLNHYNDKKRDVSVVEMPYSDENYSMLLFLPNTRGTLNNVMSRLTVEDVKNMLLNLRETTVDLSMPKFTVDANYDMKKILSDMGASGLFLGANFRGFTESSPPMRVDDVIHRAYINVNEEGTEAAAATAVTTSIRTGFGRPREVVMEFNHPFLFMIVRQEPSESHPVVMFMGVAKQPEGVSYRKRSI